MRKAGKSRGVEMNRNRAEREGGALSSRRNAPSDSPGVSSSRSRTPKSGADRSGSAASGRGGAGSPSGTSSSHVGRVPRGSPSAAPNLDDTGAARRRRKR